MGAKQKRSLLPFILNVAGLVAIAILFQNCSSIPSSKGESINSAATLAE